MPEILRLTPSEVDKLVGEFGLAINAKHARPKIFGIPRGGTIIALMLRAKYPEIFRLASEPGTADVFVDDILDSGATAKRYKEKYNRPVYPLYDKMALGMNDWVVFPWEEKDSSDPSISSGEDIAIRLLEFIGEDPKREGLQKTPERFIKAWRHWTSGYQGQNPKEILTSFSDGAEKVDEMIVLRHIPVWSTCEHHLAPFFGTVSIGYVPNDRIVGLSKFSRLVDVFAHRLQVQERLTNQIADAIMEHLEPKGVGVQVSCRHTCMESRGIHQPGIETHTNALRGVFRTQLDTRQEFLQAIK